MKTAHCAPSTARRPPTLALRALNQHVPLHAGMGVGMEDVQADNRLVQASLGLGGPRHVDCGNGGRSSAVWVQVTSHRERVQPTGWWLLFPDVGLAIELCDGVLVSWDGRSAAHCTCVPRGVPEGDELCSLFFGVSSKTASATRKMREFGMCVRADHAGRGGGVLVAGDVVWVRWCPESRPEWEETHSWRRRSGRVVTVQGGDVHVKWFKHENGARVGTAPSKHVVRAGSVGPLGDSPTDSQLIGKRVCVYWPDDYYCYHGCVVGWNADRAEHHTAYDDGQEVHEVLGGCDAPYWMVL